MTVNSLSCCFCSSFGSPSWISQGKKTQLQISSSRKRNELFNGTWIPSRSPNWLREKQYGNFHYASNCTAVFRNQPEPEPPSRPDRTEPSRKPPAPIPTVYMGDTQMDIYSRLAKDRILLLGRAVDDEVANALVAQMLFLANEDPSKDITLYINSPGGSVSAGLAVYDTMQFIPCDVSTVCFGTAASMAAFLLGAGTKGKRKSLPNARIMIHQPLGGAQGQAADIEIQAREILFIKSLLNTYMADYTGKPLEKIEQDTDRDFFMTPEEALEYGMIDEVIQTKKVLAKPQKPALL
ncbi:ATP-dependent Clp protease proteolytic subunit 1 [Galdieria sulphuraria]|uniref:ATP-dependent Clp protease proteolytic subunit n=1 Tax=Galdieria sulphuraria TaxID=130081 RepID=M2VV76_GALSU|nr:ATP-dependent Clp protease, protease subunit [Galdieria sulphuraria]EME27116.1 ATP-dependent Clp protease, protease subunit [Galdieria sulphuraria]GJD05674.1 ATP-dependent Clp protease proteolytic subunit 1 [Galdieria sulphuraria]|eukprot:XP_005703636.1 ATP-dependent Clp protease, protease subunit [Galdieria sulphuraria]